MATRGSRLRRAQDETMLRYGPEARGLKALMRELRTDLDVNIRSEEGAAAGLKQAISHVQPQIRKVYANAGLSYEQADADVAAAGADSTASAREAASAKRRLAESLADAQTELSQRKVDTEAGRAYGVRQARATFQTGAKKVRQQSRDLEQEMGTYASTTYRDLQDADAKLNLEKQRVKISRGNLRLSRRRADETHRHNTETEAQARAREKRQREEANKPEGPSRGAITAHQGLVADIQDARRDAAALRRNGVPWSDIATVLQSSKSEKNPYGGHGSTIAAAGIQLARSHSLKQPTVRSLKSRGLLPGRMPAGWRRTWRDDAREGVDNLTHLGMP